MEQIQFIRQKLQIPNFPQFKTREFDYVRAPEIILACIGISFFLSIIGLQFVTYLTLGFALPAVCRYKDIKIFNYWECFAMLLFFRRHIEAFESLDGIFLLLLWHPTFRYGLKIVQWIKSLKEKGHIEKGINQIKKVL